MSRAADNRDTIEGEIWVEGGAISGTQRYLDQLDETASAPPLSDLTGKFHAHLTIPVELGSINSLEALCKAERVKLTVIDLENVEGRRQQDVMSTSHYTDSNSGAVGRIVRHLAALTRTFEENGFPVVRAKLEHESLPSLSTFNRQQYHEVHIKLKIPNEDYLRAHGQLRRLGEELNFAPSQNPRERNSEYVNQFVNMRIYEGDINRADEIVSDVVRRLRDESFDVAEVKRETTLFDSRQSLDQWWM